MKPPSADEMRGVSRFWLGDGGGNGGGHGIAIAPQVEADIRPDGQKRQEALAPARWCCPARVVTKPRPSTRNSSRQLREATPMSEIPFAAIWDLQCRSGNRRAAWPHQPPPSPALGQRSTPSSAARRSNTGARCDAQIGGIHAPNLVRIRGRCESQPGVRNGGLNWYRILVVNLAQYAHR